jgi:hypothetical protein
MVRPASAPGTKQVFAIPAARGRGGENLNSTGFIIKYVESP